MKFPGSQPTAQSVARRHCKTQAPACLSPGEGQRPCRPTGKTEPEPGFCHKLSCWIPDPVDAREESKSPTAPGQGLSPRDSPCLYHCWTRAREALHRDTHTHTHSMGVRPALSLGSWLRLPLGDCHVATAPLTILSGHTTRAPGTRPQHLLSRVLRTKARCFRMP